MTARDAIHPNLPPQSGTPLWKKLGIKEGARVLVIGAPEGFDDLLEAIGPMPPVERLSRAGRDLDVVVLFATELRELDRRFARLAEALDRAGRLWVAWPKGSSSVPTDLTFDAVQGHGLACGLVDNKTAAIDADFTGLQFVYRRADR
ncbi:MAG: DUF3052 domain-containing protein [Actinomycetota bacterium]